MVERRQVIRDQYAEVIILKDEGNKLSPMIQENAEAYAQSKGKLKYNRGEGSQKGSDVDDEEDDTESFGKS